MDEEPRAGGVHTDPQHMQQASPPAEGRAPRGPSRVVAGVVATFVVLLVIAYLVWIA